MSNYISMYIQNGRTALVLACIYGYKDSMRYLLEAGADVSYPDEVII